MRINDPCVTREKVLIKAKLLYETLFTNLTSFEKLSFIQKKYKIPYLVNITSFICTQATQAQLVEINQILND